MDSFELNKILGAVLGTCILVLLTSFGASEVFTPKPLEKPGFEVASEEGVTVALDTTLDDELRRESRVYELIHHVNTMRKDTGLGLSDRIALTLPACDKDLLDYREWIAAEVLADSIEIGNSDKVVFEKI